MTWQSKLEITKKYAPSNPEMVMVFDYTTASCDFFITYLKNKYPFVEEEYLDFLRITDGIYIDTFVIFGSDQSKFSSISKAEVTWNFMTGVGVGFIPIGMYPSGDSIAICSDAKIRLLNYTLNTFLDGPVISSSFSSLMNDFLLGNRFTELFLSHVWSPNDETDWTQYLRQQNWL